MNSKTSTMQCSVLVLSDANHCLFCFSLTLFFASLRWVEMDTMLSCMQNVSENLFI